MIRINLRSKDRSKDQSCLLNVPAQVPQMPTNSKKKKTKERMKEYRDEVKQNPEIHNILKQMHAEDMRSRRSNWTEEEKERNKILSRERMRRYRQRKQKEKTSDKKDIRTRQDLEKQKQQREKWKEAKRNWRNKLTSQKKRRIREKDRERKRLQNERSPVIPYQSKSSVSIEETNVEYSTQSALNKAVTRAKSKLPKSASKFALVVSKLIEKASPRKTQALELRGVNKSNKEVTVTFKDAYEALKGRRRQSLHARRELVRQIAKQKNKQKLCLQLGINRKFLEKAKHGFETKKRKDAITEFATQQVEDFFMQEDVSINVPNKKAVDRNHENKFVLQTSYKDCYKKFQETEPEQSMSFSKFVQLKPKNVLCQKKRQLYTCLCEYCESIRLKINAINKYSSQMKKPDMRLKDKYDCVDKILCPKDGQEYRLKCIDGECNACSTEYLELKLKPLEDIPLVTYQSWDLVPYVNEKTGKASSKRELVQREDTPAEFIQQFLKELKFLAIHLFEARWQQQQFRNLSKSVKPKQIMMTADFAENYNCFSQNEVQGAHWTRNAVTIHPTIINYRCPSDGEIVEEAVDVITDDLNHDAHAVNKFVHLIHEYLTIEQNIEIEEVIIVSDGCASQYKCKTAFMDASNGVEDLGVTIQRDYYGSRHGKNRCDGEGGILKSSVSRATRNGAVINSAKTFADHCRTTLTKGNVLGGKCNHKRRHIIFVEKAMIDHTRQFDNIKPLKGTRKLHSVKGVRKGEVQIRRLSCFCKYCLTFNYQSCENKDYVDQWEERTLLPARRRRRAREQDNLENAADNVENGSANDDDDNGDDQWEERTLLPARRRRAREQDNLENVENASANDGDDNGDDQWEERTLLPARRRRIAREQDNLENAADTVENASANDDESVPGNAAKDGSADRDESIAVDNAETDGPANPISDDEDVADVFDKTEIIPFEFDEALRVDISFNDISFNQSMEMEKIIEIIDNLEPVKKIHYNVGQHILVKFGLDFLPAVVDEWPWIHYFRKFKDFWKIDDIKYTITPEDVIRELEAPLIRMVGRNLCYTFTDLLEPMETELHE